jgi:IS1 family transposase
LLHKHYQRLANEFTHGDRRDFYTLADDYHLEGGTTTKTNDGRNQQHRDVEIRFVEIEFSPSTKYLIQDQLRIQGVPTVQVYYGLRKVWEQVGSTEKKTTTATSTTKDLRNQLVELRRKQNLLEYSQSQDDGILLHAIEESLYDYPSFLDEEW